ncbi:hypothetical protein FKP32DRAFT_1544565, partial [Trametes sanguinea]
WLVVLVDSEPLPVIWHLIKDGWTMTCDEASMTMSMRSAHSASLTDTVQRLRFFTRHDYWNFVANLALGRVQA